MTSQEIHELAEAWIRHAAHILAEDEESDELCEAWEKAYELKYDNPEALWQLILEIHKQDKSRVVAEVLSAGPLEDLLAEHGEEFIEVVETQAKQDPSFAFLLGGVWQNTMTDEVWQRVQAVWDRRGWDGIPKES